MFLQLIIRMMQIAIVTLFLSNTNAAFAQTNMRIYTQPPSPDELAQTLFPKRYRGIVINDNSSIPATSLASESSISDSSTSNPSTSEIASGYQQPGQQENMFGLLINFEYDSTNILGPSLPLLDSVGEMLNLEKTADRAIVIEGHADSSGSQDYNQSLSERRARAIRRYLVSVFDIDPARLVVIGKGELELYDRRNSANPINRRVVFKPASES